MEGVFCRYEPPLLTERGHGNTLLGVNADLQTRIRSLFVSRNDGYPPKTPRSSSDHNYLAKQPSNESSGDLPHLESIKSVDPTAKTEKPGSLKSPNLGHLVMGATRFDGQPGIVGDSTIIGPHRNPSQPGLQSERSFDISKRRTSIASGLNHKTRGDLSGRESNMSDALRRGSSLKKPLTLPQARNKHYNLRIVPPKVYPTTTEHLRPSPQHVPGSYRSEVDNKNTGSHQGSALMPANMPIIFDDGCPAANAYIEEPTSRAVDSLKKADMHALSSSETKPKVHHAPFERFSGESSPVIGTAPFIRLGTGSPPSHDDTLHAGTFVISDDGNEPSVRVPEFSPEVVENVDVVPPSGGMQVLKQPEGYSPVRVSVSDEEGSVPFDVKATNGPQLSELLKHLPPVRKAPTMDAVEEHVSMRSVQPDLERPQVIRSRSSCSLRSVPLDANESIESPIVPLLPKWPPGASRVELDQVTKPSPVSRALSMLSEISARSGFQTPSSHSTTKHQRLDENGGEGARHWVRQMLGKRSTSSVISPNLTARTHYREQRINAEELRPQIVPHSTHGSCDLLRDEDQAGNYHEIADTEDSVAHRHHDKSEPFAKVIIDLESLLKEALDMADEAASRDQSDPSRPAQRKYRKGYGLLQSAGSGDSDHSRSSLYGTNDQEKHSEKSRQDIPAQDGQRNAAIEPANGKPKGRLIDPTRHQSTVPNAKDAELPFHSNDWAYVKRPVQKALPAPRQPPSSQIPPKQQQSFLVREHGYAVSTNEAADLHRCPNIQPRSSSLHLPNKGPQQKMPEQRPEKHDWIGRQYSSVESESEDSPYVADFRTSAMQYHPIAQDAFGGNPYQAPPSPSLAPTPILPRQDTITSLHGRGKGTQKMLGQRQGSSREPPRQEEFDLQGRHHFSIREPKGFSLSRSHRRTPIARDWSTSRKRYVATVTCVTTALMGLVIGVYAGEVPAIQYAIADEHHYTILGNVVFFIGLAVTTSLFYPLPLLHGRKPYTLAALVILLPLQFPQAWVVDTSRSPYAVSYRLGLLLPRAVAGFVMGFANINFKTTLLDLFGSSLQSGNPHQETVNENDVRRHGGGMGIWLSIWTWCSIGSIGVGFLIGAEIISGLNVSWGFWVTIILNALVLLLNVTAPEVRRSPYRRSMAEVRNGGDVSRRIAKGEIKMHLESTGPLWWGEEVFAGHVLFVRMLKQPGFAILSVYLGWIYGQVVMIIVLLGALLSRYYAFHPQYVGLSVAIIPLGALIAVPFQKASLFSRARHHPQRTDSMTFEKRVTWTSHLVRRAVFMVLLPFAGMAYTLSSSGPPVHYMVPIMFAGVIGFLSNLAIAECNGLIMETFDTSDLQPGMTGRPRRVLPEEVRKKRTNFSCFPRVTAGFSIAHTFAFLIAAAATGWGGVLVRHLDAQKATGVVAGILLILTLLLIAAVTRYKVVQIIPSERFGTNILSGPEDEWSVSLGVF